MAGANHSSGGAAEQAPPALDVVLPSDREVRITRTFDAPRRLVFEAWTSPQHLPRWMLGPPGWTMTACEVDLRPGGAYRYAWQGPDGAVLEISGTFREVAPPERLVAAESWGADWPETINTLLLDELAGRTTITMTVLYPTEEARDAALQTGMKEGMASSFDRLAEFLGTMV